MHQTWKKVNDGLEVLLQQRKRVTKANKSASMIVEDRDEKEFLLQDLLLEKKEEKELLREH